MASTTDLTEAMAAFQRGDLDRSAHLAEQAGGAQAQHLLGLIQCRRGNYGAGVGHLRIAADAEPNNAAHRLMLARALIDDHRASAVLEMPAPPRDQRPESLALWHVRAEAAQAAKAWDLAADAWQLVAAARPGDWRAWSNLGNALAALERWDAAAGALRRAVNLHPNDASLRRNLSATLGRLGRHDQSVAELTEAIRLEPNDLESRLTLSRMHADAGRQRESVAELSLATDLALKNAGVASDGGLSDTSFGIPFGKPRAGRELGLLLERTNRLGALRKLLDEAAAAGVPEEEFGYLWAAVKLKDGQAVEAKRLLLAEDVGEDTVRWHRLMARIEDALGNPAGAFAATEAMNQAVLGFDDWLQRGIDYRARLRGLMPMMTEEWAARLPKSALSARRSPAFLVGFPRSGTTLLDTFLMGHPGTEVLEEVHMVGAAEKVLGHMAQLPGKSPAVIAQARDAYFAELDQHVAPGWDGLVVDKLPLNMLALPLVRVLFPDAKIIFAQRHPCDAVLSGFMQSFVMNGAMASFLTIDGAADLYDVAMAIFTHSRAVLGVPVHTLVYEQLVADPAATLRPLIDFLELAWDDALLDHQATARARGAIITPSYDQVTEPLSTVPSGRWRRYAEQLAPVLPVLLPWAERLGYANDSVEFPN